MLKKAHYLMNEPYCDDYNLVVGVSYGSEGIIPCHGGCDNSCVSSSGDSLCGGYNGHSETIVDGTTLYIVRCGNEVKCNH